MADDDEIDILGDFSFNSCFAQNNQGIPSCSDREDTVHPQWLLDSTANNWYDIQNKDNRTKDGPSRKLSGNNATKKYIHEIHTAWSQTERELLRREMAKYGRNVNKISQTITTKTEAEIQALIEAEYGVYLETPHLGLAKVVEHDGTPIVVQEEVVGEETVNINDVLNIVSTGSTTVPIAKKPFRRKNNAKNSLLKTSIAADKTDILVNPSDIVYDDDLIIGSTQSIGSEIDTSDIVMKNLAKQQKEKVKTMKKIGNHRRNVSRNYDRGKRNRSKEMLKSPQGRQRKDSSLSEDSVKSPKMQIVFSSGHALPVSEGEQVIKIEKKKDSDAESDIEIDIDSDTETETPVSRDVQVKAIPVDIHKSHKEELLENEAPIAVPLGKPTVSVTAGKFEPMPKRNKRINLDGGGGYTIMHTAAGDLYQVSAEPRKERAPRKAPVHLIHCRVYNTERPAPCEVSMKVSTLISMDVHAHTSRGEVMGLLGGHLTSSVRPPRLLVAAYQQARAASARTHCDMDPVSQAAAAARLHGAGLALCGWHHSHPQFAANPSVQDLRSQRQLQRLASRAPCLALVTSQHWPPGRAASHYRCFRVEDDDEETDPPTGYQFSVKLVADLTADNLALYLTELRDMVQEIGTNELSVNMNTDVCPQAGLTFLEKCISSVTHHMRSAGYADDDPVVKNLINGIRDIFR